MRREVSEGPLLILFSSSSHPFTSQAWPRRFADSRQKLYRGGKKKGERLRGYQKNQTCKAFKAIVRN